MGFLLRVSAPDGKGAAARVWKHTVLQSRIAELQAPSPPAVGMPRSPFGRLVAGRSPPLPIGEFAGADPAEHQCHAETKRCQVAK